ncbi:MAG: class I SAM-dependent methyltransferase [Mycobacteriales bacterium]|nr:class I SAM-dependent methyltransferase [Mycobacteriales bacterium]
MDVSELVRGYYGADASLSATIVAALASAGIDVDVLAHGDLALVDHLHAGGAPATQHVLERLGAGPEQRLLDVGSGVGGPSRMAALSGAIVTGVDLTPEFVEAATELTARVGLDGNPRFVAASAESLPFEDATFDAAMIVHAGMNMPDKAAVFGEVHRVLVPGSRFALYEQMASGTDKLAFPLPWAEDARSSFLETVEGYTALLENAGFTIEDVDDRTDSVLGPRPSVPVGPADVYGPIYVEGIGNYVAAAKAGKLRAVLVTAVA